MLTEKRVWQIATIMVIKIANKNAGRPYPLTEFGQIKAIADCFGITNAEAEKILRVYIELNRTKIMLGSDDKDNVTFSNLEIKAKEEAQLGEISIKLLERKIYLEGLSVTPRNAKVRIRESASEAGISMLEAAEFERYIFDYFYNSVIEQIDQFVAFETGKAIVENIEFFKQA